MTALAAYRNTKNKGAIRQQRYPVKASTTIYGGAIVMIDSAGFARPAAALASNQGCVGIAQSTVVGTAVDGAVDVVVDEGVFLLDATSITQAMITQKMYAQDDHTVDETQGSNQPLVGTLVDFVSTTSGWVHISAPSTRGILG